MSRLRSKLSYANVASSLALFLAVSGGTAVAAATISSSDIQRNAVTNSKIARNAVTASKINNGAISGRDMRDGSIENADLADGTITAAKLAPGTIPEPTPGGGPAAQGVISAPGALVRGSGVAAVTSPSAGVYAVTFNRDVSTCTPVASIGGAVAATDPDGRVGPGTVAVSPSSASNATLVVETRNVGGEPAPRAFSFLVQC